MRFGNQENTGVSQEKAAKTQSMEQEEPQQSAVDIFMRKVPQKAPPVPLDPKLMASIPEYTDEARRRPPSCKLLRVYKKPFIPSDGKPCWFKCYHAFCKRMRTIHYKKIYGAAPPKKGENPCWFICDHEYCEEIKKADKQRTECKRMFIPPGNVPCAHDCQHRACYKLRCIDFDKKRKRRAASISGGEGVLPSPAAPPGGSVAVVVKTEEEEKHDGGCCGQKYLVDEASRKFFALSEDDDDEEEGEKKVPRLFRRDAPPSFPSPSSPAMMSSCGVFPEHLLVETHVLCVKNIAELPDSFVLLPPPPTSSSSYNTSAFLSSDMVEAIMQRGGTVTLVSPYDYQLEHIQTITATRDEKGGRIDMCSQCLSTFEFILAEVHRGPYELAQLILNGDKAIAVSACNCEFNLLECVRMITKKLVEGVENTLQCQVDDHHSSD